MVAMIGIVVEACKGGRGRKGPKVGAKWPLLQRDPRGSATGFTQLKKLSHTSKAVLTLSGPRNPFLDDHLIYAVVLIGVSVAGTGRYLGFGRLWEKIPLVKRFPVLK